MPAKIVTRHWPPTRLKFGREASGTARPCSAEIVGWNSRSTNTWAVETSVRNARRNLIRAAGIIIIFTLKVRQLRQRRKPLYWTGLAFNA